MVFCYKIVTSITTGAQTSGSMTSPTTRLRSYSRPCGASIMGSTLVLLPIPWARISTQNNSLSQVSSVSSCSLFLADVLREQELHQHSRPFLFFFPVLPFRTLQSTSKSMRSDRFCIQADRSSLRDLWGRKRFRNHGLRISRTRRVVRQLFLSSFEERTSLIVFVVSIFRQTAACFSPVAFYRFGSWVDFSSLFISFHFWSFHHLWRSSTE